MDDAFQALHKRIKELEEEVKIGDRLLAERTKLLRMIPACPEHGEDCVPNAMEWVQDVLELIAAEDVTYITPEAHERRQAAWRKVRSYGRTGDI